MYCLLLLILYTHRYHCCQDKIRVGYVHITSDVHNTLFILYVCSLFLCECTQEQPTWRRLIIRCQSRVVEQQDHYCGISTKLCYEIIGFSRLEFIIMWVVDVFIFYSLSLSQLQPSLNLAPSQHKLVIYNCILALHNLASPSLSI